MIYLILFFIALISTWLIFKKVLKIAIIKNIVDKPEARKIQLVPVPVLGGIAVFWGIVVGMTSACFFYEMGSLFVIMGILAIMLYVGTLDDILGLSPTYRLVVEILVVLLLVFIFDTAVFISAFHRLCMCRYYECNQSYRWCQWFELRILYRRLCYIFYNIFDGWR